MAHSGWALFARGSDIIVALSAPANLEDEKTQDRIAGLGKRIVLSENEQRTIDLRAAKPPQ